MSAPVIEPDPVVVPPDEPVIVPTAFTGRFVTCNHWRVPPWPARMSKIVELMTSANAHWFGTQETEELAERGILERIEPAGTYKVFSDKSNINIIGRGDKFRLLWHGEYSVKADNRSRYYQAAKLEHIETGVIVLAVNAHFSNGSRWAAVRTRHAEAIVKTLADLQARGIIAAETPIILTGDFNDSRRANQPGPAQVFKAAGLIDARDVIGLKSRIDLVYGRNVTFRAWTKIATGIASDHDWYVVTADVGVGAPLPPPPIEPPSFPVRMYVRPLGDPVWKAAPFEVTARDAKGDFIDDRVRAPGYPVVGVIVDFLGDKFVRTASGSFYRMSYLTVEKPK